MYCQPLIFGFFYRVGKLLNSHVFQRIALATTCIVSYILILKKPLKLKFNCWEHLKIGPAVFHHENYERTFLNILFVINGTPTRTYLTQCRSHFFLTPTLQTM